MNLKERFLEKILIDNSGCHLWQGQLTSNGYGRIKVDGIFKRAHRIAYELFVGPIPEGLSILHSCDIPACVNPTHLRPGTHAENVQDAIDRGRFRRKFTEDQIRDIRERRAMGVSRQKIADLYSVHHDTIWEIDMNLTYKWVK